MGLYYHLWKYFGMREMLSVFYSTSIGSAIFVLIVYLSNNSSFPRSIFIFEWAFMFIAFFAVRSSRRYSQEIISANSKKPKQRALIVGAGNAGRTLVSEMLRYSENKYMPIGFIDDDKRKWKAKIDGVKVFGGRDAIPTVVKDWEIDIVVISIPSAKPKVIRELVEICSMTKVKTLIVPALHEIVSGSVSVSHIRELQIEDLLGRKQIEIDSSELNSLIYNKVILVTGAGGSIGSELCLQICSFKPKLILLLGHGENSIFKISNMLKEKYPEIKQVRIIIDIKDKNYLEKIFEKFKPNIVFHAAAHKHVPLMEENVYEAIMNNVYGTRCLVEVADKYGVEKFVNISTDKAVNPISIMGVTKRIIELIVKYYSKKSKTAYMTVRFGNVIGSRGSVIPIFQEQIEKQLPITITHPDMKRYFMTIPEAVQLVTQASAIGSGSEIFVLDMGEPIKISDLALNMIRLSGYSEKDVPIVYTGLRNGEKIDEQLFMEKEKVSKTKHEKILLVSNEAEDCINFDTFISDIDKLIEYTRNFDNLNINIMILKIVTSYNKKAIVHDNFIFDNKLSI